MSEQKLKVAVIGASGYSGEELLRLLSQHPHVEIACITSRQYAGQGVEEVFPRLGGSGLIFSAPSIEEIAAVADLAFLALPHGVAAEFAVPLLEKGVKIIDISADFRLRSNEVYKKYYGDHPAPELLDQAIYALPERNREAIKTADLIACPGCYPTSNLIPLLPLLDAGIISSDDIRIFAMSGVSGAGRKVALDYIFPECNESARPYAVSGHRHIAEIEQELAFAAGKEQVTINFIPHLIPVNRGIHSTIIVELAKGKSASDVRDHWQSVYADEKFVRVLPEGKLADTKNVTRSNVCEIACVEDSHTGRLIISSAIDNLQKGASGQAVQNMNIRFGFTEDLATGIF